VTYCWQRGRDYRHTQQALIQSHLLRCGLLRIFNNCCFFSHFQILLMSNQLLLQKRGFWIHHVDAAIQVFLWFYWPTFGLRRTRGRLKVLIVIQITLCIVELVIIFFPIYRILIYGQLFTIDHHRHRELHHPGRWERLRLPSTVISLTGISTKPRLESPLWSGDHKTGKRRIGWWLCWATIHSKKKLFLHIWILYFNSLWFIYYLIDFQRSCPTFSKNFLSFLTWF